MDMIPFGPKQLGINIHYRNYKWYGLDSKKTLQELMKLPFQHVRIPIPYDEVNPKKGVWDFSTRDYIVEQALKQKKIIHLQVGLKTIGYPEFNIPRWLSDLFPSLITPRSKITPTPQLQQYLFEYLQKTAERFFPVKEIASIHGENEAFSKRLHVSNFRSLSPNLVKQEVALIRNLDRYHRPIIQNFPFDTPEAGFHSISQSDIIGINIYNQFFESELLKKIYWPAMNLTIQTLKLLGKRIIITEFQVAPWISSDKQPAYPFSEKKVEEGFLKLKNLKPQLVFLWDVEQLLWRGTLTSFLGL